MKYRKISNNELCTNCNKPINDIIYMSCDSANCSQACATMQLNITQRFDPNMEYPYQWNKYKEFIQNENNRFYLTTINTSDNLLNANVTDTNANDTNVTDTNVTDTNTNATDTNVNNTDKLIDTTIPLCILGTLITILFVIIVIRY